jgi:hypothetical protein
MKDILTFLGMFLLLLFVLWISFVFFDMVFNSDLSPFWKWIILR